MSSSRFDPIGQTAELPDPRLLGIRHHSIYIDGSVKAPHEYLGPGFVFPPVSADEITSPTARRHRIGGLGAVAQAAAGAESRRTGNNLAARRSGGVASGKAAAERRP
jgi:hypothetical protein